MSCEAGYNHTTTILHTHTHTLPTLTAQTPAPAHTSTDLTPPAEVTTESSSPPSPQAHKQPEQRLRPYLPTLRSGTQGESPLPRQDPPSSLDTHTDGWDSMPLTNCQGLQYKGLSTDSGPRQLLEVGLEGSRRWCGELGEGLAGRDLLPFSLPGT